MSGNKPSRVEMRKKRSHELDAYQFQRRVDPNFKATDQELIDHIRTHPAYKHVPDDLPS